MTLARQDLSPVVQTIEIDAPPDRVFELWTKPEELIRWWPDAAELEPCLGGRLRLEFQGRGEVWGELTRFEPPNGLGFTWIRGVAPEVTTYVDVTIEDLGNGRSRVELVHSGFENVPEEHVAEWRAMHDAGWMHFLGCLTDLAGGRRVDKQFVAPTTD